MILGMLKQSAKRTAKKTALTISAVLCFVVGFGFLTSAAWIGLADAYSALTASLIVGAVYFAVGLVILILANNTGSRISAEDSAPQDAEKLFETPKEPSNLPPLAQAFMFGLNAGFKADGR